MNGREENKMITETYFFPDFQKLIRTDIYSSRRLNLQICFVHLNLN